jgi:uncharacterized protein DUF4864
MHTVVTCVASAVLAGILLTQTAAPPEMTRAAGDSVMRQLEAFRSGDYRLAYTFASSAIRQQFDQASFERMVMGGYRRSHARRRPSSPTASSTTTGASCFA